MGAHRIEPVMPPKEKKDQPPLTPEELGLLKLWIDSGAKEKSWIVTPTFPDPPPPVPPPLPPPLGPVLVPVGVELPPQAMAAVRALSAMKCARRMILPQHY